MILTIFGYSKTGKTTLFNLLTDKKEEVSKFSASSQEFHKAIVNVPDERLKELANLFETPPVYAKIEFLDAGHISFGEAKSSTFIDLLRRADGLVHMVRGFEDEEILHSKGDINPVRDIETMEEEIKTVDFISIEKRVGKLKEDTKKIKDKTLLRELDLFTKMQHHIEEKNEPLHTLELNKEELNIIKGYKFLSIKPMVHIINCDENSYQKYKDMEKEPLNKRASMIFCALIESELLELLPEDREVFQEEYGLKNYKYIRENFIKTCYDLMSLQSFFTVGKDETKAWTINKGDTAFEAAGKIHSDIQKGFIRAEAIGWKDFLDCGSFPKAKDKGLLRLEGKEYIAKDGDILHFRFNK